MAAMEDDEPCRGVWDRDDMAEEPDEPPDWVGPYNWHPNCLQCKAASEAGETDLKHHEHQTQEPW